MPTIKMIPSLSGLWGVSPVSNPLPLQALKSEQSLSDLCKIKCYSWMNDEIIHRVPFKKKLAHQITFSYFWKKHWCNVFSLTLTDRNTTPHDVPRSVIEKEEKTESKVISTPQTHVQTPKYHSSISFILISPAGFRPQHNVSRLEEVLSPKQSR